MTPKKNGPRRRRKPTKKKLSAEERASRKLQRDHQTAIRNIFRHAGFHRVTGLSNKDIQFDGVVSELDDLFISENIVVVCEYTCSQSSNVGDHLRKKKIFYDKILDRPADFIQSVKNHFPTSVQQLDTRYHLSLMRVVVLYCSRHDFDATYKNQVPRVRYLDYPAVRYFFALAQAIKRSMRHEFMHFLGISSGQLGKDGKTGAGEPFLKYNGSVLPEAHSNFEDGYKVVSFYSDAESLLRTTYVLRKDGWRDSQSLYQRMVSKRKIERIRVYLKDKKRVFVNNIIVTLPQTVKLLNDEDHTVLPSALIETQSVRIEVPDAPNSIGIIDGQHRVFAYHESSPDDESIARLRQQQNLLVTGIVFPPGLSRVEREKFEARLFLEINSTQTKANSRLKHAIGLLTEPFATESIATRVLERLASTGPLAGHVSRYFFDSGKLKTASIVSYGLKPLVKTSGSDSAYSLWHHPRKSEVANKQNEALLAEYVDHAAGLVNTTLVAVRRNIPKERWTSDRKVDGRILTTTYVNAFLILLRKLIDRKVDILLEDLNSRFKGVDEVPFKDYRSSQYARLADDMVERFFSH